MICPKCKANQLTVVDSRPTSNEVRRRRECLVCHHRFTTVEISLDRAKKIDAERLRQQIACLEEKIDRVRAGYDLFRDALKDI